MRRDLILSIVDQAILSAFNLGLSLLLVALAPPDAFGLFVVLISVQFVLLSVQNALVVTPLNVLIPGRAEDEQRRQLGMLASANLAMVLLGAVGGAVMAVVYGTPPVTAVAAAATIGLALMREYARNVLIVSERMARALVLDLVFVAVACLATALLWQTTDHVTAALGGMAVGSAVAVIGLSPARALKPRLLVDHWRSYGAVWTETRWALLGAVQTEGQSRGYVFLVEAWRGTAVLAGLQAGRTILSPLQLAASAWGRIARPKLVAMLHRGELSGIVPMVGQGALIVGGLAVAFGALIVALWPLIETYVFRGRYTDMAPVVLLWWLHATLLSLNGVVSTLLQARRQFRELALIGMATAGLCLVGLLALTQTTLPAIAALFVLIAAEALDMLGQLWLMLRRPLMPVDAVAAE